MSWRQYRSKRMRRKRELTGKNTIGCHGHPNTRFRLTPGNTLKLRIYCTASFSVCSLQRVKFPIVHRPSARLQNCNTSLSRALAHLARSRQAALFPGSQTLNAPLPKSPALGFFPLAKGFKTSRGSPLVKVRAETFPPQSEVRYPRSVVESREPAGTHRSRTIA
jgi:hypothetical protein